MKKKPTTLKPILPNAGIEAAYRKKLESLVDEMNKSILYWISAAYKKKQPELAQDASPAVFLSQVMKQLAKRWQKKFDEAADKLAVHYSTDILKRSDGSLMTILKEAGFAIDFKLTRSQNDVLQACVNQNVSLIKSIPSQHFTEIEGVVQRSVAAGGDLFTLSKSLNYRFAVTKRRAALIARDQVRKTNADLSRARHLELGMTKGIWKHSHAGKQPRKSHQDADGKEFDIAEGCLIDGEHILPGVKINCRCFYRPIFTGIMPKK